MTIAPQPEAVSLRAVKAMLAIAAKGSWPIRHFAALVRSPLAHHARVPAANVVIVPTVAPFPAAMWTLNLVMAKVDYDGLIVSLPDLADRVFLTKKQHCALIDKHRTVTPFTC